MTRRFHHLPDRRHVMKERLRNYWIRKSAGLPVIHWSKCGWRKASPEDLQRFDALNAVVSDPAFTSAVGAIVE